MSWWKIPTPKKYRVPEETDCQTKGGGADYDRMAALLGLRKSIRRMVHATDFGIRQQQEVQK